MRNNKRVLKTCCLNVQGQIFGHDMKKERKAQDRHASLDKTSVHLLTAKERIYTKRKTIKNVAALIVSDFRRAREIWLFAHKVGIVLVEEAGQVLVVLLGLTRADAGRLAFAKRTGACESAGSEGVFHGGDALLLQVVVDLGLVHAVDGDVAPILDDLLFDLDAVDDAAVVVEDDFLLAFVKGTCE